MVKLTSKYYIGRGNAHIILVTVSTYLHISHMTERKRDVTPVKTFLHLMTIQGYAILFGSTEQHAFCFIMRDISLGNLIDM